MPRTRRVIEYVAVVLGVLLVGSVAQAKNDERATKLPEVVANAFKAAFPNGTIVKADAEKEDGIEVYDIEFKDANAERECDIASEGTILNTAVVVDVKSVPEAAMKAIIKAAGGGAVVRVEKSEILAEGRAGKITKLDKARIEFEAEIEKGDRRAEVTVAHDGTVVEGPKWIKKGKKGGQESD